MSLRLFGVVLQDGQPAQLPWGIQLLPLRDLAAAVEPTDVKPKDIEPADIDRYRDVIQALFEKDAVLPAPVGTTFKSEDALRRWMGLHYITLSDALAWVEHRMAARVHVRRPPGAGQAGAGASAAPLSAVVANITRQLRGHIVASVPLPSESEAKASAAFLVEREQWQNFSAAVSQLGDAQVPLHVEGTGPWPPYDFVRLQFGA